MGVPEMWNDLFIVITFVPALLFFFPFCYRSPNCKLFMFLYRYKHFNAGPINAVSFSFSPKTVDEQ